MKKILEFEVHISLCAPPSVVLKEGKFCGLRVMAILLCVFLSSIFHLGKSFRKKKKKRREFKAFVNTLILGLVAKDSQAFRACRILCVGL